VYDGECWPSNIPRFYFNPNDTHDGVEENKTSIVDPVDDDLDDIDIIFEIVNETELLRQPSQSPPLNIYDDNETTTTTTPTATPSTPRTLTSTTMPLVITTERSTTTHSSIAPNSGVISSTTTESTVETTQNDILFAKQIIQDFESMLNLPALESLEKGHDKNQSTEGVTQNLPVKKTKEIENNKNKLVLLENDIPRIPKELLHDAHDTRYTRKPKKVSKIRSHEKSNSNKLRTSHVTPKPSKEIEKVKTLNPVDLMFELDDDFTGQDLPKLYDILNGYHFNNKTWSGQ
jgi:hypothetical protein